MWALRGCMVAQASLALMYRVPRLRAPYALLSWGASILIEGHTDLVACTVCGVSAIRHVVQTSSSAIVPGMCAGTACIWSQPCRSRCRFPWSCFGWCCSCITIHYLVFGCNPCQNQEGWFHDLFPPKLQVLDCLLPRLIPRSGWVEVCLPASCNCFVMSRLQGPFQPGHVLKACTNISLVDHWPHLLRVLVVVLLNQGLVAKEVSKIHRIEHHQHVLKNSIALKPLAYVGRSKELYTRQLTVSGDLVATELHTFVNALSMRGKQGKVHVWTAVGIDEMLNCTQLLRGGLCTAWRTITSAIDRLIAGEGFDDFFFISQHDLSVINLRYNAVQLHLAHGCWRCCCRQRSHGSSRLPLQRLHGLAWPCHDTAYMANQFGCSHLRQCRRSHTCRVRDLPLADDRFKVCLWHHPQGHGIGSLHSPQQLCQWTWDLAVICHLSLIQATPFEDTCNVGQSGPLSFCWVHWWWSECHSAVWWSASYSLLCSRSSKEGRQRRWPPGSPQWCRWLQSLEPLYPPDEWVLPGPGACSSTHNAPTAMTKGRWTANLSNCGYWMPWAKMSRSSRHPSHPPDDVSLIVTITTSCSFQ